jgi:serine/threonine protein kinase
MLSVTTTVLAVGENRVSPTARSDEDSLMIEGWPVTTPRTLHEILADQGCTVVRQFGERRDSRSVVVGVAGPAGERYIVKHAEDSEAISWLESARRFHAAVRHPSVPTVLQRVKTRTGVALVEEWGDGEILVDGYDPAVPSPDRDDSPLRRFLRLPVDDIARALGQLIGVHVSVAAAGYVAVDLYDGCVLYDFTTGAVRLIDLDHYRPGPYVLATDRQLGSSSYMAPEEFERGATIDERTTVYTLGRMALVYLGCPRKSPPRREDFRGSDEQFLLAMNACARRPDDRIHTVGELEALWHSGGVRASAPS